VDDVEDSERGNVLGYRQAKSLFALLDLQFSKCPSVDYGKHPCGSQHQLFGRTILEANLTNILIELGLSESAGSIIVVRREERK
jgi:hypothetical protein